MSTLPTQDRIPRDGFSLLEILLALAILGGSLAILSRIVETGTSAAIEARALAEARLVCQTKLTEILLDTRSGNTPQSVVTVPVDSFDDTSTASLNYSVEVLPQPIENVMAIRVTVAVQSADAKATIASYSLTRWLVDPTLDLEQLENDERATRAGMVSSDDEEETPSDEQDVQ